MAVAPQGSPTAPTTTPTPTPTAPAVAAPEAPALQPTEPTADEILPALDRSNTDPDVFDEVDDGFLGVQQPVPDTPVVTSATPPLQPTPTPEAAPAEPGQQPAPTTTPPADGAAALEEYRKNAEKKLESYFALDEGAANELATDPVVAVPKLMAKVMYETIQATMQSVNHFLPSMIEQHNVRQAAANEVENKFYAAWPQLDRKVHGDYIRQAATIVRQMRPNATLDDVIRDVGAQTMVAFKIPAAPPPKAPWQKTAQPQAPTPPHRPAAAAAPRAEPTPPAQKRNIFMEMANEHIDGRYDD